MIRITRNDAADILKSADKILILTHQSPDGDTLGSGYAICRALRSLNKQANVICGDIVPAKYDYLSEGIDIQDFEPEFILAVDIADPKLLGKALSHYGDKVDLCIDHHGSNTGYANRLLLDDSCAACSEIIYDVINIMGVNIDKAIAECIYTGISTDTGCFRYSNTTANSHFIVAKLMETGFNYFKINRHMFEIKSRERIEMEIRALEGMEYFLDGKVAIITLTSDMINNSDPGELEGITPLPRQVEGVRCGITLKQHDNDVYRISVRTGHDLDASKICARLGGGGHKCAAGCSVHGTRDEVIEKLLNAIKAEMSACLKSDGDDISCHPTIDDIQGMDELA